MKKKAKKTELKTGWNRHQKAEDWKKEAIKKGCTIKKVTHPANNIRYRAYDKDGKVVGIYNTFFGAGRLVI